MTEGVLIILFGIIFNGRAGILCESENGEKIVDAEGVKSMVTGINISTSTSTPTRIGDYFCELQNGFDHYYIFDKIDTIKNSSSGRVLEFSTIDPGGLFYDGPNTSDKLHRESGIKFGNYRGLCLETSHYPIGANITCSPSAVLLSEDECNSSTSYKFSTN